MMSIKRLYFPILCGTVVILFYFVYASIIPPSTVSTHSSREWPIIMNNFTTEHVTERQATVTSGKFSNNDETRTSTIQGPRSTVNSSRVLPPTLPDHFIPLTQSEIDGVEKFVLFIGYPRSGHSIIGSYMDSHPNMIIAHEYPLLHNLDTSRKMSKSDIFNNLYEKSFKELQQGWRGSKNVENKGYSLAIEGLWQATFDKLKVIGNKHGGVMVKFYRNYPDTFLSLMNYIEVTVNIPVYIIHVVRNPFDMIATQSLYADTGISGVRTNASIDHKFNKPLLLAKTAKDMLMRASAAAKMMSLLHFPTLEVHNEDLIHDPVQVMRNVCDFVEVECPEYYLRACKENTFSSSSKSRYSVVWPPSLINSIQRDLKNFGFFQRYSFSD